MSCSLLYLCFILLAAQAIHRINVALASGEDSAATLEALKSSTLALRSITDECSDTYRTKLMEAQKKKAESAGKRKQHEFVWVWPV